MTMTWRRPRQRTVIFASLLVAVLVAAGNVAVVSSVPDPPITFVDEFDLPADSPVDGTKWQHETGDNPANREQQYYTGSTENAVHDGQGNLVITARKEDPGKYRCWYGTCLYTSARINTAGKFAQPYGHFEARVKMSHGQGMWPAFWLLGEDFGRVGWPESGEIDVMENIGKEPDTVHGTLHGPGYSGAGGITGKYSINGSFADRFHVFAIDWSPGRIAWSVDGNVYQTRTRADVGTRQWVFDKPFFMILNLAVGGQWPGPPDATTAFPKTLIIDYVRVTGRT